MLSCFFKEILADSANSNNLGLQLIDIQCSDFGVEFGLWLWEFRIKDYRFYSETGIKDLPITVS